MKSKTRWFWFILAVSFLCYSALTSWQPEAAGVREHNITVDISEVWTHPDERVWIYDTDKWNFTATTDGTTAYDLTGKEVYFAAKKNLGDTTFIYYLPCTITDATGGLCNATFETDSVTTAGLYYTCLRVSDTTNILLTAWSFKLKALDVASDAPPWGPPTAYTKAESDTRFGHKIAGHTNTWLSEKNDFSASDVRVATPTETNQPTTMAYVLGEIGALDTDDVPEGSNNFYYTETRGSNTFENVWPTKDLDDLPDGPTYVRVTPAEKSAWDGKLDNIVEDTTPQLGGNLDGQTHSLTNMTDGTFSGKGTFGSLESDTLHEVSTEGLVLGMNFNTENNIGSAGSETILDSSTYNNHGTNHGATHDPDGGFNGGGAFEFDGTNNYVDCGDDSSLNITNAVTIGVWVKPEDTTGSKCIGHKVNQKYGFWIEASVFKFITRIGGEGTISLLSTTEPVVGEWYHIVGTYDKDGGTNNKRIYVNGVSENQVTETGTLDDGTSTFWIGLYTLANPAAFTGQIDDVRVYNRALSADEISQLYEQQAETKNCYVSQKDIYVDSDGKVGIGTTSPDEKLCVVGNVVVGDATVGANGTRVIMLTNGTIPSSSPAGAVQLYAEDVSSSSELKVRDEAGNITTLSPHSSIWPTSLAVSQKYPQVHVDQNDYIGEKRYISMGKIAELVEGLSHQAGLLPADKQLVFYETIEKQSWDANQEHIRVQHREKAVKKAMEKEVEVEEKDAYEDIGEKTQLKRGIRFDEATGKFYRKKTREEAEATVTIEPYQKKQPPVWIQERLEKKNDDHRTS